MSATLFVRQLSFAHGATAILDDVSLTLGPRRRLGVVGANGAGKSTLLRLLAGALVPDGGSVTLVPPTASVVYSPQEPDARPGETVLAYLARRTGVADAEQVFERAAEQLASDGGPEAEERYAVALERYLALGGPDLETRAVALGSEIGLPADLSVACVDRLSGGEAARAALAAVLLSRQDVLLLDEPTNNLDFEGLERLEAFLAGREGALAVVSHDRAFLERTVDAVLELDEMSGSAVEYDGGWAAYLEARAVRRRHAERDHASYVTERSRLEARARRQRDWATSGAARARRPNDNDKAQRDFRVNRTEKQASKVRASERAMDRLAVVDKPWEGWDLRFDIAASERSGAVVAELEGAMVCRGAWRLGPLDLALGWGERAVLVGPNGAGKTTLLDVLAGRVPLEAGRRRIGPGVVVGEIAQARARLDGSGTVLAGFVAQSGLRPEEARRLLAKFGLDAGDVSRSPQSCSPGERTRAELALLMAGGANFLVLDEPTNHLDLPAIEQLELALDAWEGTLLLVSHDRRLLETVRRTKTLELDRSGHLTTTLT